VMTSLPVSTRPEVVFSRQTVVQISPYVVLNSNRKSGGLLLVRSCGFRHISTSGFRGLDSRMSFIALLKSLAPDIVSVDHCGRVSR